jgi:hypothetical protein
MVSVLQRAFACFSCQGVNSRQASKTKESRAKADSRLNLWQPQTKIFFSQNGPGAKVQLKGTYYTMNVPVTSQGMMI